MGTLGLALLLGLGLPGIVRAAEAPPQPAPAAPADTVSSRFILVETILGPARQSLSGARLPEHGGYVEKGLASIDQTVADIEAAKAYLKDHPEADKLDATQGSTTSPIAAFPDIPAYDRTAQGTYRSPAMVDALVPLKAALQALVNGPTGGAGTGLGDLGGYRDKITNDLVQAGNDIVAGMDYNYRVYSPSTNPATPPRAGRGVAAAGRGNANANRGNGNRGTGAAAGLQPLPIVQMNALVLVEGDAGKGSGFTAKIGDKFYIITNLHVLSGQGNFTLTGMMDGTKYPTTGALFASEDADIAFLSIPPPAAYLEILDGVADNTKINDAVTIPGNAAGAGVATQVNGRLLALGPKLLEVNAQFVAGNSGSPIIHRPTGKVIGVATYTVSYPLSDLKALLLGRQFRWFGFRLDVANQLQPLDWKKFQADGAQLKKIEETTDQLVSLLQGGDPGAKADPNLKSAYATYLVERDKAIAHKKDSELTVAAERFSTHLRMLTDPALKSFQQEKLYPWHATQAREQETYRTEIFDAMQDRLVAIAHLTGFGSQ